MLKVCSWTPELRGWSSRPADLVIMCCVLGQNTKFNSHRLPLSIQDYKCQVLANYKGSMWKLCWLKLHPIQGGVVLGFCCMAFSFMATWLEYTDFTIKVLMEKFAQAQLVSESYLYIP